MRWFALLLLLGVSGCWVTTSRGEQIESRIQRLEGESDLAARQLEEQRVIVRQRVTAVDAKIVEVQRKLDELNATAHRSGADLAVNQDRLQEEVVRLRGILEEQAHRLGGIESTLGQQKGDTEARFAALRGAGALEEFEARKKLEALKRPDDKGEFFSLAQERESAGERALARALYGEFAEKWPGDARAADAHFRVGEILFGDRRYREAILEYGKVVQDFPRIRQGARRPAPHRRVDAGARPPRRRAGALPGCGEAIPQDPRRAARQGASGRNREARREEAGGPLAPRASPRASPLG